MLIDCRIHKRVWAHEVGVTTRWFGVSNVCVAYLMNDRDVPSFHDDKPIANETTVLQFTTRISWLGHHYLGFDPERLRAGMVGRGRVALMRDMVRPGMVNSVERWGCRGSKRDQYLLPLALHAIDKHLTVKCRW